MAPPQPHVYPSFSKFDGWRGSINGVPMQIPDLVIPPVKTVKKSDKQVAPVGPPSQQRIASASSTSTSSSKETNTRDVFRAAAATAFFAPQQRTANPATANLVTAPPAPAIRATATPAMATPTPLTLGPIAQPTAASSRPSSTAPSLKQQPAIGSSRPPSTAPSVTQQPEIAGSSSSTIRPPSRPHVVSDGQPRTKFPRVMLRLKSLQNREPPNYQPRANNPLPVAPVVPIVPIVPQPTPVMEELDLTPLYDREALKILHNATNLRKRFKTLFRAIREKTIWNKLTEEFDFEVLWEFREQVHGIYGEFQVAELNLKRTAAGEGMKTGKEWGYVKQHFKEGIRALQMYQDDGTTFNVIEERIGEILRDLGLLRKEEGKEVPGGRWRLEGWTGYGLGHS
ncbi:hypothetical protein QBC35DRAFT_457202 [Podospora australis]|uniref:Uncharacterized protein n=1 Tax=Podospora australis TaxID=1536484 RepID=A0AAN7AE01_9PEZI|nr:hypothetical protein QBC35DRAFT_457202 [Podospora australis]